jgi:hypothetical protein
MSGAVVDNPKHAARIIVGRSCHDLFDQTIKRRDTVAGLAAPKDTGAVDIQCGEVGPGAAAIIFVFDLHGAAGAASMCRVLAPARLDAGLLIRGYDEFIILQRLIFPATGIQVQQPARLFGKLGITRENPAAVIPGTDGILVQPPPDRTAADGRNQASLTDLTGEIAGAPARQW